MIWLWIIIAVIIIAGLIFWVKSGNKDDETDLSADIKEPEVSAEESETSEEPEISEEPKQEEEKKASDEDKIV